MSNGSLARHSVRASVTRLSARTAHTSSRAVSAVSAWSSLAGSSTAVPARVVLNGRSDPSDEPADGPCRARKHAPRSSSMQGDIASPGVAERLVAAAEETGLAVARSRPRGGRDRRPDRRRPQQGKPGTCLGAQGGRRIAAARSHRRPRARLVGWLLVGGVPAGLARAGGLRVRECVARCPGRVATSIGSACHHDQLGPVVGRRNRSLADTSVLSIPSAPAEGIEALESLLAGNLARVGRRTAAPRSRSGRIPRDPATRLFRNASPRNWTTRKRRRLGGPRCASRYGSRRGQPDRHRASAQTHFGDHGLPRRPRHRRRTSR